MFDDPNKELRRLQDRLLAAEEQEDETVPVEDDLDEIRAMLEPAEEMPEQENRDLGRKGRIVGILAAVSLELLAVGLVLIWWMLWKQ